MTDDPMEELRALKARLAYLESLATQPAGEPMTTDTLADAMAERYGDEDDDTKARAKALGTWTFQADPQREEALRARAKDPAAYDAELARMGGDPLALAVYREHRAVAIQRGTFTPEKEETE